MRLNIILDFGYQYILIKHNCSQFLGGGVVCVVFFCLFVFDIISTLLVSTDKKKKNLIVCLCHVKLPILLQYQILVENIAIFEFVPWS